jgi:hypothetical protein
MIITVMVSNNELKSTLKNATAMLLELEKVSYLLSHCGSTDDTTVFLGVGERERKEYEAVISKAVC